MIARDVESQLCWSAFVDAYQIDVSARDGVVTLHGEVDLPQKRAAAVANAFDGGAVRVDDRLAAAGRDVLPPAQSFPLITQLRRMTDE